MVWAPLVMLKDHIWKDYALGIQAGWTSLWGKMLGYSLMMIAWKRGGGWFCRNNPLFTINSSCCSYTTAVCFRFHSLTVVPVCCRHLIKILSVWPRLLFAAVDCSRVLYWILNLLWLSAEIPCFYQNEVYCHNRNLHSLDTFKEV